MAKNALKWAKNAKKCKNWNFCVDQKPLYTPKNPKNNKKE